MPRESEQHDPISASPKVRNKGGRSLGATIIRLLRLDVRMFLLQRSRGGRWLAGKTQRLNFIWQRFRYQQRERAFEARLGGRSTFLLLKIAVAPVVCAVVTFSLLWGFAIAYEALKARTGWQIPSLPAIDAQIHTSLMGTIAQASAAVLALFFAAMSVVASTSYAKFPIEVRALVANDDLNQRYLKLLAYITSLSIIALAAQSAGYEPNAMITGYIAALAAVAILCFFGLGARTFALFSPVSLSGYPLRAFARSVQAVTPRGHRWQHASFQKHANDVALQQLEILEGLVVATMSDEHPSMRRAVHDLTKSIHRLLRLYVRQKPFIPTDSLWFSRKAKFGRLQLGTGVNTDITLQTGVVPPSPPAPDYDFVEQRCDDLLVRCLAHTLTDGSLNTAEQQLLALNTIAAERARMFQPYQAASLACAVTTTVVEWLLDKECRGDTLGRFQVIDVACVIAIAPILNSSLSLTEMSSQSLMAAVDPILKCDYQALHRNGYPQLVLIELEDVFQRIAFERAAEGRVVTQRWYIEQLVAGAYASFIRDLTKTITETLHENFVLPPKRLIDEKMFVEASIWLHRAIEACSKADQQVQSLTSLHASLKEYHHTEVPWHPLEEDKAIKQIASARSVTVRLMGKCIPELVKMAENENLPDLIGQTQIWLADELLSLMERKAVEAELEFGELFIAYFEATTTVAQRMINLSRQPEKSNYVRAGMDAMYDLLEISGIALLVSELDGTPFMKIVEEVWNAYWTQQKEEKNLLLVWLNPFHRFALPVLLAGDTQRFRWGQRLVEHLQKQEIGLDNDDVFSIAPKKHHPNPIIRSLHISMGHLSTHPAEYFAALYLAPRADSLGVDLPHSVQRCREAIAREKKREKEECEVSDA